MTEIPTRIFEATSVADLQVPLQRAFASAAAERGPVKFRLKLAPGLYEGLNVSLDDMSERSELILIVECEGGVATLTHGLNLRAGRVLIRNVVLADYRGESPCLEVRVAHQFLAQGVAVVDGFRRDPSSPDPLVRLAVSYGSQVARAVFRQCWFVGNRADGQGTLIATPKIGRGTFELLDFEEVVFAHNALDVAVDPWFSAAVNLRRCLAHEDRLQEAFLRVASPLPAIGLEGGTLAVGRLVHFVPGPDVARGDFGPIRVEGTTLYMAEGPEEASDLAVGSGAVSTLGLPSMAVDDLAELARRLEVPTADLLGRRLS